MQKNFKLIIDTHCEVYDQLYDFADGEFIEFEHHKLVPGAVYMIGRIQFRKNSELIRTIIQNNQAHIILSNPAEGSETMRWQFKQVGVEDLALENKIIALAGGDMESQFTHFRYEAFMVKLLDYVSNREAMQRSPEIFAKQNKPYKFLFLNGRARPHRRYLIDSFRQSGLLDQSLWTSLDTTPTPNRDISLMVDNINVLYRPGVIQYLPEQYEVGEYQHRIALPITDDEKFVKSQLFNASWGEIYLTAEPYIDTYFSLVTETVFSYPYSFRTEKMWKPIVMGHPWIAVANAGYYRDLHNLGFKSFGHLIDESFDQLENNQQRIERITQVVEDLCRQDLSKFLEAAKDVCKYNQQQFIEIRNTVRTQFPEQFFHFINQNFNE